MNMPYIHTDKTPFARAKDWFVAILPILVWSVFMFGARVISLCVISSALSLGFDYLVQRFVFKQKAGARVDLMSAVYGILAAFVMPVAVSLWLPVIAAMLVVLAKNVRVFRAKRLFNPFVFSAAALNLMFPNQMTAFTRPFAYFSAFDLAIDPKLLNGYRVISPLQYIADGSVFEDGVVAQFYGFASGAVGEVAVVAIIISAVWLFVRKVADWRGTIAFLLPVLLLALSFPSDDAESNYYAYSVILSGGTVFLSVFATNESHTVPLTRLGRMIFGAACGVALFVMRKYFGGFEWGYFIVLMMNVASPFVEKFTKPRVLNAEKPKKVRRAKA